jgi:hypothetical protein
MIGEYSGKNGNRGFLGGGKGWGIAWDPHAATIDLPPKAKTSGRLID